MLKQKEIKWLFTITHGYRKVICVPLILSTCAVALSIVFVEIQRIIIENIYGVEQNFLLLILILIVSKLMQFLCETGENYYRNKVNSVLEYAYSLRVFSKLFNSATIKVRQMHSGDEMSRLTTDVGIVSQCVSYTMPLMIYALIQLIFTSCYLVCVQPLLTVILIIIMPIMIIFAQYYTKLLIPLSKEIRERDAAANGYMQEHLQKHELLSSLGVSHVIVQAVKTFQQELLDVIKKKIKYDVAAEAIIDFGFTLGYIAVLVWGILGIKNGNFTYALLLVFLQLVGQLERPFILLKSQYPIFVNSLASADRLIELEKIEDENITDCRFIGSPLGIKLRNVTFNYNNKKHVYTNFSYDFKPASITAIIGETGVGKSTLFRLILSQIYPTRGSVVFYTTDGKEIPVTPNVRCNCTYVPQGNSLLSGTIRYNLKLGNLKASDSDMIAALHSAVADFVINELPDGLDTIIGENGIGLSEGQSQRIAIARGLLKDCNIILLDEPTSALDPNTEALLLKRLTSYYSNKTILIITHKTEICQFISNTLHIERGL